MLRTVNKLISSSKSAHLEQAVLRRNKASGQALPLASAGLSSQEIYDREDKYGAHNYHPIPVALSRGKGTDNYYYFINNLLFH